MRKNVNSVKLVGWIFNHDLAMKVTGDNSKNPGTSYISGDLNIAVDEEGLNVVPVHFTYVTPTTARNKKNLTYDMLADIITKNQTWETVGKENAQKVVVDTSIGVNDFVSSDGEMVSSFRLDGGFVTRGWTSKYNVFDHPSDNFTIDVVLNSAEMVEENPERGVTEHMRLKGYVFDFRNAAIPVTLAMRKPGGIKYFDNLDISNANPLYTQLYGSVENQTCVKVTERPTAFGDVQTVTTSYHNRELLVLDAALESYTFDDEATITSEEMSAALQQREVRLAEIRQRDAEYRATKAAAATSAPATNGFGAFSVPASNAAAAATARVPKF